ncbi:MAG: hypothetical protein WB444_04525 [Gallionella sp.]
MKFLSNECIEREDGEVRLILCPATTTLQGHLIELGSKSGADARMDLTRWCLKNCVDKISISGAEFNPAQLADKADLADNETFMVMLKIGKMAVDAYMSGV